MAIDSSTFHGFMIYVLIGAITFPIWGPLLMVYCAGFIVWMLVYCLIYSPIRWVVTKRRAT